MKHAIQEKLYARCIDEYQSKLHAQTDPYLLWLRETEQDIKEQNAQKADTNVEVAYIERCGSRFSLAQFRKKYLLFVSERGSIADNALSIIAQYFDAHAEANIVYADEDVLWSLEERNKNDIYKTRRIFPWTKPVWSPDTLLSFLYFGNVFAVRRAVFLEIPWLGEKDYKKNIYDFVLKAVECGGYPAHIEKMLFHSLKCDTDRKRLEEKLMQTTDLIGVGSAYDAIRESAFLRRGIEGVMQVDEKTGISYPIFAVKGAPLVSIVIPSKDNPEVLKQCIRSVYAHTDYPNFEIIVVDNGSAEHVQEDLRQFQEECHFTYLYQPMPFNFSCMCNMGVKEAKGTYILLLNDDMEVIEASWLTRMVGQASLAHVGAVGAKLLYPNSAKIQHVGITNTIAGPGHKLKLLDDGIAYYYGRNRFIYDLIGVTAACLLMRREVYLEIGGLFEGLAVAYNDVDLCFRLYEKGLYNVQRNDVVLYHHESLSRGDDMQDEGKRKRLMAEKNLLYSRHKQLYGKDPFIGTLLNSGEPEYSCRWLEGYELENLFSCDEVIKGKKKLPNPKKMNQAIMIVVEDCGRENFAKKAYYLIKGWAYVPNVDNARYQFKILLVNSNGSVWELPVQKRYRKDVAAILPHETNVELTGFCSWIFEGALPPDTYDLWMTAKDGCSRQRLYRSMGKQLVVEA